MTFDRWGNDRDYLLDEDDSSDEELRIEGWPFRSPRDVFGWARRDLLMECKAFSETWFLDDEGFYAGCFHRRRPRKLQDWASDPSALLEVRRLEIDEGGGPTNWLFFENRLIRRWTNSSQANDMAAFTSLRETMSAVGVNVVDHVIFGERDEMWSLHAAVSKHGEPYRLALA
jgi:hypothetical protein